MTRRERTPHPSQKAPLESAGGHGNNIRRLREERGMSLAELAARSAISVEQLERIENWATKATIAQLWRLSGALKVPVGRLVAPALSSQHAPSPRTATSRSLLPSSRGPRRTELCEITLPPGTSSVAPPRPAGTIDSLLVTSGVVVVQAAGARHVLMTGATLELASDVERTYTSGSTGHATLFVLTSYRQEAG